MKNPYKINKEYLNFLNKYFQKDNNINDYGQLKTFLLLLNMQEYDKEDIFEVKSAIMNFNIKSIDKMRLTDKMLYEKLNPIFINNKIDIYYCKKIKDLEIKNR